MDTPYNKKNYKKIRENREISWLQFNKRIQEEADCSENPLLERAKFVAIASSNMDEFIQVRYSKVCNAYAQSLHANDQKKNKNRSRKIFKKVTEEIIRQSRLQYQLFEGLQGELFFKQIFLFPTFQLDHDHSEKEKEIFQEDIYPHIRPQLLSNIDVRQKQLHLMVKAVKAKSKESSFFVIPIPVGFSRLIDVSTNKEHKYYIRIEDVIKHYLDIILPKYTIEHTSTFRVLRNQNFPVEEHVIQDILPQVRAMLAKRQTGEVMRLEVEECMSEEMLNILTKHLNTTNERIFRTLGPIDLNKMLMGLYGIINKPELKYPPVERLQIQELMDSDPFGAIEKKDYLFYHPYHSFTPFVQLMKKAATDPTVTSIKQTLYRVSSNSPIASALVQAAENGKNVVVLMESHARFDEENNLFWAERMERAGCTVLYGLPMMKVHSKITLFERNVDGETRLTIHLGTGNYNENTSKLYTDLGLLTSDKQLCDDAVNFFEKLEGGVDIPTKEIMQAPDQMRNKILDLIDRERMHALEGRKSGIIAKMNSLSDKSVINSLLLASQAGVQIQLIVRGICCLKPLRHGVSENIQIRSIVGRNLEHARAFCFENDGDNEVYLSSADWMPRNLYRRVELMFPVKDPVCKQAVKNILKLQLMDTSKAFIKQTDGSYVRLHNNTPYINSQEITTSDVGSVMDGSNEIFSSNEME